MSGLDRALPDAERTLLLRATLIGDDDAWNTWRAQTGGLPRAVRAGSAPRPLLPLLHETVRRAALPADAATLTLLRTAAVHEELRAAAFERAAADVLRRLTGLDPVVTGGAALAAMVYPAPALRHCHDLDLLVTRAAALAETDVRVRLHTRLVAHRGFGEPPAPRTRDLELGGAPARTLAGEELLWHVCVRAVLRARPDALVWAADAWHLMTTTPELDWARVLALAESSRTELPLAAALGYVARQLDAPIPLQVLEVLAERTSRRSPLAFLRGRLAARGT